MKEWLRKLGSRIDELSIRERALVMVAVVAVLFMVWDTFLMQPLYQERSQLEASIASKQASINRLSETLQATAARRESNPNARLRKEQEELRDDIADLDVKLSEASSNVISPERMATVLQEVLRRQQSLELIEIRSIAPEAIFTSETAGQASLEGNVYRHGLVMELEGTYLDLLRYLKEIEALPYTFMWDKLLIETISYPRNRITIRVHTLSLSEELIGA